MDDGWMILFLSTTWRMLNYVGLLAGAVQHPRRLESQELAVYIFVICQVLATTFPILKAISATQPVLNVFMEVSGAYEPVLVAGHEPCH